MQKTLIFLTVIFIFFSNQVYAKKNLLLNCEFKKGFQDGKIIKPNDTAYNVISASRTVVINYNEKKLDGNKASLWNESSIEAPWKNVTQGSKAKLFVKGTLRLNRNSGEFEVFSIMTVENSSIRLQSQIFYSCEKFKKKF